MAKTKHTAKTLTQAFDKSKAADELRGLIANATILDGSYDVQGNTGYINRHLEAGDRVFEWRVQREPPVYLLPPRYGRALLPVIDVQAVSTPFYSPGTKALRAARRGDIVLEFTRRGQSHHFMMNKELVERFLDPLKRRETVLMQEAALLEAYAAQYGVPVADALEILKRALEEEQVRKLTL